MKKQFFKKTIILGLLFSFLSIKSFSNDIFKLPITNNTSLVKSSKSTSGDGTGDWGVNNHLCPEIDQSQFGTQVSYGLELNLRLNYYYGVPGDDLPPMYFLMEKNNSNNSSLPDEVVLGPIDFSGINFAQIQRKFWSPIFNDDIVPDLGYSPLLEYTFVISDDRFLDGITYQVKLIYFENGQQKDYSIDFASLFSVPYLNINVPYTLFSCGSNEISDDSGNSNNFGNRQYSFSRNQNQEISVVPNPFKHEVEISSTNLTKSKGVILYTINGEPVMNLSFENKRALNLNLANIPQGTYILKLLGIEDKPVILIKSE